MLCHESFISSTSGQFSCAFLLQASANVEPQLYQPSSGLIMTNEIGTQPENALSCFSLKDPYLFSASGGKISIFNLETFEVNDKNICNLCSCVICVKLFTFSGGIISTFFFLFIDCRDFQHLDPHLLQLHILLSLCRISLPLA